MTLFAGLLIMIMVEVGANEIVTIPQILAQKKRYNTLDKAIQVLKNESLEKSISLLLEGDLYFWNNYQIYFEDTFLDIPLKASAERNQVIAIMGNRRFLKVLDELSRLPRTEAANLLNKEIINSLDEYEKLFNAYMAENEHIFKHNLEQPNKRWGLGFVETTKDGSPTLISQRYKVWALILIAGNLELRETKDSISKVLEEALKQRETFCDAFMLYYASLYNRQILGTAVLGTYVNAGTLEQLQESRQIFEIHRLTHYSSSKALYDMRVGSADIADYSKGELKIICLKPLEDLEFDNLIKYAGDINKDLKENVKKEAIPATIIGAYSSGLPGQAQISNVIRILGNESVKESLKKLDEIDLYIRNAQIYMELPPRGIPLHLSAGQINIIAIMGNRRFLKVMHELSLLPKEEAGNLVSEEIISSLNDYNKLFDSFITKEERNFIYNLSKSRKETRVPINFIIHTEGEPPTLLAVHYKILALALIAGNLQLQQAKPSVDEILKTAIEQRNMFYNKDLFDKFDACTVLTNVSLYNRQILGTAVLGTYVNYEKSQQILKETGQALEKLTRYNSSKAVYDLDVGSAEGADYSKGELQIKYLKSLDDSKFDNLMKDVVNDANILGHY